MFICTLNTTIYLLGNVTTILGKKFKCLHFQLSPTTWKPGTIDRFNGSEVQIIRPRVGHCELGPASWIGRELGVVRLKEAQKA